MQYETVVLEMLSRIQALEQEVARLRESVRLLEEAQESAALSNSGQPEEGDSSEEKQYGKVTDRMIDICYVYGKKSFEAPEASWNYADEVVKETDMNRNSAFMYMYVVRCLLSGSVFKRSISMKALKQYLMQIEEEYGKVGLAKALQAVDAFMDYRRATNQPVKSVQKIYREFKQRL